MEHDPFASFVPRFVRERLRIADELTPVDLALDDAFMLFADISGSTELAERLAQHGPGGAEEMARRLNDFFGMMIDVVEQHGGDITGFAGDALMACWPASADHAGIDTVRTAVQMQALLLASGQDDRLHVRISVGRGGLRRLIVGGYDDRWHSVVTGSALVDAGMANHLAQPDDVVISALVAASPGVDLPGVDLGRGVRRLDVPSFEASDSAITTTEVDFTVEQRKRLAGFVPVPVLVHLEAGHDDWLPELRTVTVIFSSLPHFDSTLALDVVEQLVFEAQRDVALVDARLKISVDDKGVALLAVLGMPPRAHEDDARRGARLAALFSESAERAGVPCHVGVSTGRVFCGALGNGERREYTLIGSTVNRAARLMSYASTVDSTSAVLADEATVSGLAGAINVESLATVTLKGLSPMRPSRLLAGNPDAVDGVAAPHAGAELLVGREHEVARITEALEHAELYGAPTIILEGEAGIGKSTLAAAAMRVAEEDGFEIVRTAGDSIETTSPYRALRALFRRLLGVASGDHAAQRNAIEAKLGPALASQAVHLNEVLPVSFEPTDATMVLPADSGPAIVQSLVVDALAQLVANRQVLLSLEDYHWFDAASSAVIVELASRRLCGLLVSARSDELSSAELEVMGKGPHVVHCLLGPLGPAEIARLVALMLGAAEIDDAVAAAVAERGDGHPLFTTELVRTMMADDMLEVVDGVARARARVDLSQASFPDSVEGLIGQRIDRLPIAEQLTLRAAAVVGPEFGLDALIAIHPAPTDRQSIHDQLDILEYQGLIHRSGDDFRFAHRLMRDVSYDRVLFSQRAALHASLAEFYEQIVDAEDVTGRLAHHWERSWLAAREVDRAPVDLAYVGAHAANALERATDATLAAGLPRAALEVGLRATRVLGVDVPTDPALVGPAIGAAMQRIAELAGDDQPAQMLELPAIDNPDIDRAVMLLLRLQPAAAMAADRDLFALLALTNYVQVLEHGLGMGAPGAIAVYGSLELLMSGATERAHERTTIALEIARRQGGMMLSYTAFVHSWLVNHWHRPLREIVELGQEASRVGFDGGDVLFGSFNGAATVVSAALAGAPLDEVVELADFYHEVIDGRVHSAAFHCRHERQFALALAGRTTGPQSFTDDRYDDDIDIASILQTPSLNQIAIYLGSRVRLSTLYRDYASAVALADRVTPVQAAMAGQFHDAEFVFYATLARLLHSAEADESSAPAVRASADAGLALIAQWAAGCAANFLAKHLIASGVAAAADGRQGEALDHLADAVNAAAEYDSIHQVALAHELSAVIHDRMGNRDASLRSAAQAIEAYTNWGAHAKVDDVRRQFAIAD